MPMRLHPATLVLLLLAILAVTLHPAYDLQPATAQGHNTQTRVSPHCDLHLYLPLRAMAVGVAVNPQAGSAPALQSTGKLLERECAYRC